MRDARLQCRLVAMEIQHAARVAVVVERLGRDHLVQHALRVHRDPVLAQRVAVRLGRGALGQELQRPAIEPRIGREPEPQRLVLAEQRLQQDPRRPRRGPHEGMPRRDHAGIAPARLARHGVLPLEQHDLVAVPEQLIGRGHADHAATHDQNAHGRLLDRWGGELKGRWAARGDACRPFGGVSRARRQCGAKEGSPTLGNDSTGAR